jgi:hypothetical protein
LQQLEGPVDDQEGVRRLIVQAQPDLALEGGAGGRRHDIASQTERHDIQEGKRQEKLDSHRYEGEWITHVGKTLTKTYKRYDRPNFGPQAGLGRRSGLS